MFSSFHKAVLAGATLATFGVLAGCTVVTEEPPPYYERPRMCTQEYAPVCARRGGDRRTFSNDCYARSDGYRVVHRGECRAGRPLPPPDRPRPPPDRPRPPSVPPGKPGTSQPPSMGGGPGASQPPGSRPTVCTQEYAPVCGIRGGDRRTFSNDCYAAAEGYRVLRRGECR